jgi:catechol 2,3-dioxygenase-like lactoylglutathione lyase family enzyme
MKLGYIVIYVPDVKKAVEFYKTAFGMSERFVDSDVFGELETGATALAFVSEALVESNKEAFRPTRPDDLAPGVKIALVADDVEAALQKALENGAELYGSPVRKPWGQTVAYVRDLNGFIVEICSEIKA